MRESKPTQSASRISRAFLLLGSLLVLLIVGACTSATDETVVPAGAAKGQNTFLLFYTDN